MLIIFLLLNFPTNVTTYTLLHYIFAGKLCEKANQCAFSSCKNGGRCTLTPSGKQKCICPTGFKGQDCTEDVKECLNNPCKHGGTCIESFGSYKWVIWFHFYFMLLTGSAAVVMFGVNSWVMGIFHTILINFLRFNVTSAQLSLSFKLYSQHLNIVIFTSKWRVTKLHTRKHEMHISI